MNIEAITSSDATQRIVASINPEVRKILRRNALNTIKALREGKEPGAFTELDQQALKDAVESIARIDFADGVNSHYTQLQKAYSAA
ncbi:MAG: hypothetical protein AseanaTS_14110 [Candidatus Pelagadaptatus aseana]|uniref:hypothetical protein n=1 Tax=Candidatus Pelagadaptatus aseana TaxID=3120508 RepID=UPI0039B2CAA2